MRPPAEGAEEREIAGLGEEGPGEGEKNQREKGAWAFRALDEPNMPGRAGLRCSRRNRSEKNARKRDQSGVT